MAWHLNLDHGHYRIKVPVSEQLIQTNFGIKDGARIVKLGLLNLDLQTLFSDGLIDKESSDFYRIQIFFEKPRFFLGKGRRSQTKKYLDFTFEG